MLGGRLRLKQPRRGHRVGHDAILLAAACPARAGERVVDLGAGVGAAGLALALRVAGIEVTLVEVDAGLARLAAENAQINGLAARVTLGRPRCRRAGAGLRGRGARARVGRARPDESAVQRSGAAKSLARPSAPARPCRARGALAGWIKTAARLLRPRGTLTLIWRADGLAEVLQALAPAFGAATVLPVHPGEEQAAIRVLVRATKASRAPLVLLPGLVLNDRAGRPTAQAESVLRAGAALPLSEI